MTRRERLEARADRRETWAEGRTAKAATAHEAARLDETKTGIPLGQPILVGHHSERRHRRVIDRANAAMGRAVEHGAKAREHAAAAETIRARLESSIYSDDDGAIEALEARAAASDAEAERNGKINAAWRKAIGKVDEPGGRIPALKVAAGMRAIAAIVGATEAAAICRIADVCPACMISRQIVSTTSPRAAARRDRERIAQLKHDAERRAEGAAAVATAGGPALVDLPDGWARVTFPERPDRAVLTALKTAGWFFRTGSWHGRRSTLPASVAALAAVVEAPPAPAPAPTDDGPDYIVTVSVGLPACVIDGKRTRLVAALRATYGRNPAVELIDCAAPSAPPVWSGPLADWLERVDPLDLLAWEDSAWVRVRDLSMGHRVVLYLGDAPSQARVGGTCAALQLARKGAA